MRRTDTLDAEQADRWNATLGPHLHYAGSGWLNVAHETADIPPFYLWAESADAGTAATLPCYPLAKESPFPFCRAHFLATRFAPGRDTPEGTRVFGELMPSLFLGGRNPAHTGFGTAGIESAALREEAVNALLAQAEREAGERELNSVGMLYVDQDDALARTVLAERGYVSFPHYEAAVLDVPPGDLAAYIGTLPRAKRMRYEVSQLERAGIRYEEHPLTPEARAEMERLESYHNVKYGGVFDEDALRSLRDAIERHLGSQTRILLAKLGDRTVGSLLFFTRGEELYIRTVGFDYEAIGKLPVYFGMLFYHLVGRAQATGIRQIHYSTGSEDAKRRRGCRLVRQYAYLRALDPKLHERLAGTLGAEPTDR